jgi:SAM-dependent methyltransferase
MKIFQALKTTLNSLTPVRKLTAACIESNRWLLLRSRDITGDVLSIGSGDDDDSQGSKYRSSFTASDSYTTSETYSSPGVDLVIDVTNMDNVKNSSFDCVFCSGVLEHVSEVHKALIKIHRILKPGATLLLGLPFNQPIHMAPTDYWMFTEYGIRFLLEKENNIIEIAAIDAANKMDPSTYWVYAQKNTMKTKLMVVHLPNFISSQEF